MGISKNDTARVKVIDGREFEILVEALEDLPQITPERKSVRCRVVVVNAFPWSRKIKAEDEIDVPYEEFIRGNGHPHK